jgi:hypothetical protein
MRAREHDDCWQGCGPTSSRMSRRSRVCGEDHLPGRDAGADLELALSLRSLERGTSTRVLFLPTSVDVSSVRRRLTPVYEEP